MYNSEGIYVEHVSSPSCVACNQPTNVQPAFEGRASWGANFVVGEGVSRLLFSNIDAIVISIFPQETDGYGYMFCPGFSMSADVNIAMELTVLELLSRVLSE